LKVLSAIPALIFSFAPFYFGYWACLISFTFLSTSFSIFLPLFTCSLLFPSTHLLSAHSKHSLSIIAKSIHRAIAFYVISFGFKTIGFKGIH
jgi:hypothetical protein